jgi:hypothetical protein
VWPRPTQVGNEKYLADFWIIEASGPSVALKLATEGSKACNRKVGRCGATLRKPPAAPRQVSSDGFDESYRSQPAYPKVLKDIREAASDRSRGVRSGGERPPTRAPEPQEMIASCSTWFP